MGVWLSVAFPVGVAGVVECGAGWLLVWPWSWRGAALQVQSPAGVREQQVGHVKDAAILPPSWTLPAIGQKI